MALRRRTLLMAAALVCATTAAIAQIRRDVLWAGVQTCALAKRTAGISFPCLDVKLGASGYAVLRAPLSATHVVVMPVERITGIESPLLQVPDAGAYWRAALASRHFVTGPTNGRVPVENVGMAINSRGVRSQDQLHIHLACVDLHAIAPLRERQARIGPDWRELDTRLHGARFWAKSIGADEIETTNLFSQLATLPGSRHDFGDVTLGLFATLPKQPGREFIALASRSPDTSTERLLDDDCAAANGKRRGE